MKHKILISIFSFVLMLSFGSVKQVLACQCYSRSSCEQFGDSKAVFTGVVVEGNSPERMSDIIGLNSNKLKFVLNVKEAFLGTKKNQKVEIYTGFGFGDCGFPFEKGEIYLIYAYEEKGNLFTSVCSGSRHISRVNAGNY